MSRNHGVLALGALFGSASKPDDGDGRLLDLYWNRAQLKKEYASLRKERFALLDALKEEEGKTARLRQKLEFLEDLLAEPESASSTVVYYNLRRVWRQCGNRLLAFSRQLREQCEQREAAMLQQRWRSEMETKLRAIATRLGDALGRLESLRTEAGYLQTRVAELGGVWNYFRRRSVREELTAAENSIAQVESDIATLKHERSQLAVAEHPQFERLSLDSRRAINFTVLALADVLQRHFSGYGIADMAKTTQQKAVGTVQYGSARDCELVLRHVTELGRKFEHLERQPAFVAELKKIAGKLQAQATYNKEEDAIPTPGSLNGDGINVLAEDYWSVSHALVL